MQRNNKFSTILNKMEKINNLTIEKQINYLIKNLSLNNNRLHKQF